MAGFGDCSSAMIGELLRAGKGTNGGGDLITFDSDAFPLSA